MSPPLFTLEHNIPGAKVLKNRINFFWMKVTKTTRKFWGKGKLLPDGLSGNAQNNHPGNIQNPDRYQMRCKVPLNHSSGDIDNSINKIMLVM